MIEGQKVIKVFNHEPEAQAGFQRRNEAYRDAATRAQIFSGMMMPAMGNLNYINYAVTCCVGGLLAIRNGDLGAWRPSSSTPARWASPSPRFPSR